VNDGFASWESVTPSESKSHEYVNRSPSGSLVPALENVTLYGARPSSGTFGFGCPAAATFTTGE
jgi:hypothetical protein